MLTVFIIIHLIAFIIYASFYSSAMQDITKYKKILMLQNIKQALKEKIEKKVNQKKLRIKKYKRLSYISLCGLFFIHILLLYLLVESSNLDYLYSILTAIVFLVLLLIINWMKGAGTIDSNARLPGYTRI